jgi:hypothetical protein
MRIIIQHQFEIHALSVERSRHFYVMLKEEELVVLCRNLMEPVLERRIWI